jgi:hypothetical protein
VGEPAVVLKKKNRLGRKRGARGGPVNGVRQINIEIRDHWLPLLSHVSGGWEIGLLNVLQLAHQGFLRSASSTGIPLDRALINHDREGEAGMSLRFRHDEFCCVIFAVIRPVPVNDDAVNSATDHVGDLLVNLTSIRGVVADTHVVRSSEPDHQVRIDLAGRARIEQRVHIHFAHIASAGIAIRLLDKTGCRAGIVRGLVG